MPRGAKLQIVVGPALDTLQTIEGKYDMASGQSFIWVVVKMMVLFRVP